MAFEWDRAGQSNLNPGCAESANARQLSWRARLSLSSTAQASDSESAPARLASKKQAVTGASHWQRQHAAGRQAGAGAAGHGMRMSAVSSCRSPAPAAEAIACGKIACNEPAWTCLSRLLICNNIAKHNVRLQIRFRAARGQC